MTQVPTPPASPPAGKLRKASLKDNSPPETLDALLERYLHLLDRHQKLHEELGKQLASGFFSLTQANYSCPPGRRYGEDYYDERMKATRTISIANSPQPADAPTPTSSSEDQDQDQDQDIDLSTLLSLQLQTLSFSEPQPKPSPSTSASEQEEGEEQNTRTPESESSSSTPYTETENSKPPSEEEEEEGEEHPKPKPPRNPITWYGILVPPSLRSAQSSFTSAIEGPIPALAAIVIEMQDVERRVEAARRREAAVNE